MASATIGKNIAAAKVMLVANRIGSHEGETGGGSIFRERLYQALKLSDYDVSCLSVGKSDVLYSDSVRGVVMWPCFSNLWTTWSRIGSQDLVLISGSWSFLNSFVVFACLLRGVPCVNVITMNSSAAVKGCFHGVFFYFALALYYLSDLFNALLASGVYTRSKQYRVDLAKRGVPTQGTVFFQDQYNAFRQEDTAVAIADARKVLSGVSEGGVMERPILLYCGRLLAEKRIDLLLRTRPSNTTLAIVGAGAESERLRKFHDPVGGVVCVVGETLPQEQLRLFYRAADIHVSASNFETLGNTVHEALLCACPVVVQNSGGYITQVDNGKNGFLVNFEDEAAVQEAIQNVLQGKLSRIEPRVHNDSVDPMSLVRAFVGFRQSGWKRAVGLMFGLPSVCTLWLASKVYMWFVVGWAKPKATQS